MRKILFLASALAVFSPFAADAQKTKTASGPVQILEATQQTTKPNRGDLSPYTLYRFKIIWKSSTPPTGFFWKPAATAWMVTNTAKPEKRPGLAPGDYMIVEKNIEPKNIRNGDTILLTTHRHSHEDTPIPAEVKSEPINCLYFQVGKQPAWQKVAATIRKLPDLSY
jgi:hypothetical protein